MNKHIIQIEYASCGDYYDRLYALTECGNIYFKYIAKGDDAKKEWNLITPPNTAIKDKKQ